MENRKIYNVTDLVNELKLPRSTVNDWLVRYEQYIEFTKRGKRKVFFPSSLKVLQEIAALRTQEKSSYEIEQELAKRYPVQAEVASHLTKKNTGNKMGQNKSEGSMLPSLNNQSEELATLFGNRFEEISQYIASNQQQTEQVTRKIGRWYLTALVLFALLTAAFAFAVVKIKQVIDEQKVQLTSNQKIIKAQNDDVAGKLNMNKEALQSTRQTIKAQTAELSRIGVQLNRNATNYKQNIAELKAGLQEQRKNFATMLAKARNDAAKEKAAELARQRDAFAKQQLGKLKKLEQMAIELNKQQEKIEILKLRLSAKQLSLDEVMRRSEKIINQQPKSGVDKRDIEVPIKKQIIGGSEIDENKKR